MKYKNIYAAVLLASMLPSINYAAAKTTAETKELAREYNLPQKIDLFLDSSIAQEELNDPEKPETYLVFLNALKHDPGYFNNISNALVERWLPLFQDINALISDYIHELQRQSSEYNKAIFSHHSNDAAIRSASDLLYRRIDYRFPRLAQSTTLLEAVKARPLLKVLPS